MSKRHSSARSKRRHPCEKGAPAQRAVAQAFMWMLDRHWWRRHPAPYAKRPDGAARRAQRKFKLQQRDALLQCDPPRDDGWVPLDTTHLGG